MLSADLVNMSPVNEVLPGSTKGVGPVYCDVQGPVNTSVVTPSKQQLCVEDDLVEANTKAFQSTLHTAFTKPGPGSGSNCEDCDQWGWKSCGNGLGTFTHDRFGVGATTIDSSKPFDVVASYSVSAEKFIALTQGGAQGSAQGGARSLGVWNASWLKDGDCTGKPVPDRCTKALASTFASDGLALVVSLWKDNATKMSWLNGACDAAYPECDLSAATFEIASVEMDEGYAPFATSDYATCRLNIPWQCCYDSGLGACTKPSDGSQYCYESAHNCLVDCKGKEFCQCDDTKSGAGCDKSWFVPGAKGTDHKAGVKCVSSPPAEMVHVKTEVAAQAEPQVGSSSPPRPCYSGRADYRMESREGCVSL